MSELELAAEKYAKKEWGYENKTIIYGSLTERNIKISCDDFISGATSDAAREYWYKQFEKEKIQFAIEQLKRFREATFGKGIDVIKELEQKLEDL